MLASGETTRTAHTTHRFYKPPLDIYHTHTHTHYSYLATLPPAPYVHVPIVQGSDGVRRVVHGLRAGQPYRPIPPDAVPIRRPPWSPSRPGRFVRKSRCAGGEAGSRVGIRESAGGAFVYVGQPAHPGFPVRLSEGRSLSPGGVGCLC